ncbi:hypothetical protein OG453_01540 [Streptomyces sp. NBC_01381]|uniref:hypothetical protein n=1 Tax=Streptomyces sp. NBC_01381 TaxID=2903845 RepID=UPI0022524672|nr:hypothetical protein [Streptomyces sp. NBC_01381]MCX4665365.1 hypothetical protein [Streptomyces sp. NBC_01381]
MRAGSTAVAVLAAIGLLLTACSAGGSGTRDEGPANRGETVVSPSPTVAPSSSAAPAPAADVDPVQLIKNDPKVSQSVKRELQPCSADDYPVDVSYGNLTGGSASDVVVNVMACDDAVGTGTYVYRAEGKKYQNVFQDEEPPVYAEIDQGDLVVTKQAYQKGDPVEYPSVEDVITYRWTANRFTETDRHRTHYGRAAGGDAPAPTEN